MTKPEYGHYKGIADFTEFMVNSVDWLYTRIEIDGEQLDLATSEFEDFVREIDMKTGILTRSFVWKTKSGKRLAGKCHRGCDNLQLLKEYVHTPLQKKHIDSLCLLLWNKELLLSKAMHTFEELQGIGDIVQESIPSIVSIARKQAVQQKKNVNDNPCPLSLQLGQQYVCSVPLNGRSILGQAERQERLLV